MQDSTENNNNNHNNNNNNGSSNNKDNIEGYGILLPYRNTKGRLLSLLTLALPYGTMLFFILYCILSDDDKYNLDTSVKLTTLTRIGYLIHGIYFIAFPFTFELGLDIPLPESMIIGKLPLKADNLYWMMTGVCADLFFCFSMLLIILATQTYVQRFILLMPIAQCIYNLKNDIIWCYGKQFSPIFEKISFMNSDTVLILALFVIYTIQFFS